MKRATTIAIVGAPNSGKSTLASQVNSVLKTKGLNSVFVEEYAVEYIAEYGVPASMEQQQIVFEEQYRKERLFANNKDFVVCDSASFLSYIYGRLNYGYPLAKQSIVALNHLHKKALESLEYWDYIFYVPPLGSYVLDGVRYHTEEESIKIDKMIKGFLDLEQIPYIDLSNVQLENRIDEVLNIIENRQVENQDIVNNNLQDEMEETQ